jgi:hypothetical protein
MAKTTLIESTATLKPSPNGIYEIKLIGADVQGSSGYYSRAVLEAHGVAAFPAGTKIFIDHPTLDESDNRPERSVRDIAGYITDDPELREDGLYGKVKFGRDHQQFIEDFHSVLGMSIRAAGEIEEAKDESGTIRRNVTAIYPGPLNSVDVVTAPGAQGAIIGALHESSRTIPVTKETERTVPMDEKDIKAIVEGVTAAIVPALSAITESLKPLAPKEGEGTEPDLAAVTESAVEAGLTKVARARVVASVKAGVSIEEAIKAEKDYTDAILAEAKVVTAPAGVAGVLHTSTGNASLNEAFDAIAATFTGGK